MGPEDQDSTQGSSDKHQREAHQRKALPANRRTVLHTIGAGALGTAASSSATASTADGTTVYVGGSDLCALNPATGEKIWTYSPGNESFPSSPTVVDGVVYAGTDDPTGGGGIYAVDATTGESIWEKSMSDAAVKWSSPTIVNNRLYIGTVQENKNKGTFRAIATEDGTLDWTAGTPAPIKSSPTVVDGTAYTLTSNTSLVGFDVTNGEIEFTFLNAQPKDSINVNSRASPTVADGTAYFGGFKPYRSNESLLFAVDTTTDSGVEQWSIPDLDGQVRGAPTVVDGTLYIGTNNGVLYAIDTATSEIQWTFVEPEPSNLRAFKTSPTAKDGTVYIRSAGTSYLYAVDAATGEEKWRTLIGIEAINSSPTVANGTVYVGGGGAGDNLSAVDAETGDQLWDTPIGSPSSPTVVDDPENGSSIGSRVLLGTLGHHNAWNGDPPGDPAPPANGVVSGVISDEEGSPILNVSLQFFPQADEHRTAWTNDAIYEIGLMEGAYEAVVAEAGYHAASQVITVEEGEETDLDFTLESAQQAYFKAHVLDPNDEPIFDSTVRFLYDGKEMYNIGGPNAPYSLAPATYTVEASADGYNTVTKTITVNEGDDIEEDFILQPGPPPLPGYANPPQDLDGDGLYEDVNGDGQFDIFDVQALFETHTSGVVQDHPWAFNFSEEDDPDGVSIVDVQALFDRL